MEHNISILSGTFTYPYRQLYFKIGESTNPKHRLNFATINLNEVIPYNETYHETTNVSENGAGEEDSRCYECSSTFLNTILAVNSWTCLQCCAWLRADPVQKLVKRVRLYRGINLKVSFSFLRCALFKSEGCKTTTFFGILNCIKAERDWTGPMQWSWRNSLWSFYSN